jgi:predicted aspartyl protease
MGKVTVTFRATNYDDLSDFARKRRKTRPRAIEAEALVDTGATRFYLQRRVVEALGLRPVSEITSRTMSDRSEKRIVFSPVELEIQGRKGSFDVIQLPDTLPNIIGQIPLEHLDWVVDLRGRKLIPNPEHKHGEMADDFAADVQTAADIEDARIIERDNKAHGRQPRIPWAQAKKELGLP